MRILPHNPDPFLGAPRKRTVTDDELRERIEQEAEKHAFLDATKHDGDTDVGVITGPLMGENPDFRQHGGETPGFIGPVIVEANRLLAGEKRERLKELASKELTEMEVEEEADDSLLPDLPNIKAYDEVRMCAALNSNGPQHLDHARVPAVIGMHKQMYGGSFIVRFGDTDPKMKQPNPMAYDATLDDIDCLGFEPDDVTRASGRVETYYDYARELIEMDGAYTYSRLGEELSNLKDDEKPYPHHDKSSETTREGFEDTVVDEYSSGEMVLRIRTDIEHESPMLRDQIAFHMIDMSRPREEMADCHAWPMPNFQSGVDDYLTGIAHIIRGVNLQDSAKRQQFVYNHFSWDYPEVAHWDHVQVNAYDMRMSTSSIKEYIDAGEAEGQDDPRVPTIKDLRRRGIHGQAIVDMITGLGTSASNVDLLMSAVCANNRDLVDNGTDRYFLVCDVAEGTSVDSQAMSGPCEAFAIEGGPDNVHLPLHPSFEEHGAHDIPAGDSAPLESDDVPAEDECVWLKGSSTAHCEGDSPVVTGDDLDVVREGGVDVIHRVLTDSVPVYMCTIDGDAAGVAEPDFGDVPEDELVQFERVGPVRVDDHGDDETVVYFAYK